MDVMDLLEKTPTVALPRLDHILFLTDFSPSSSAALPHLVAIARRYRSRVYLLHVVMANAFPFVTREAMPFTFEQARERATHQLAELSNCPQLEGLQQESLLAEGELTKVVNCVVRRHGIALIVVGTHGHRGFSRLALGSVAEEIFRNSPCPVLTVGPHVRPEHEMALHRVLYATDLSHESFSAAPYALSFALEHHARLTVLHVLTQRAVGGPLPAVTRDQFKLMAPAEAACTDDCEFIVEPGNPKEAILRVAKDQRADLIVLGVHSASALATHRLRNVAYGVVVGADCPVLTVRADPSRESQDCNEKT